MALDIDLLIPGGGCAGPSLAWRLSKLGAACPSVLIPGKRKAYCNGRTWCFCDNENVRLNGLIEHRWRRSVVRSESGILPVGLARKSPSPGPGHVVAGVTTGGACASSGFAIQHIQQRAGQCCAALATGNPPTAHRDDLRLVRMMDRRLVQVLQAALALFLSLFELADSACAIRFLSRHSMPKDGLPVMKALPAKHFVRELLSKLPLSLSSRAG